jgi:Protein of unknown function (DUF1579)
LGRRSDRPNHRLQQTPAAFVVCDPSLPGRRGLLSRVVRRRGAPRALVNHRRVPVAKNTTESRKSRSASKPPAGAMARPTNSARSARALKRLEVFIGRWITEGETAGSAEVGSKQIVASDVYQWAPGGQFVMHPAYGRIGSVDVGGLEVIGYDPATGQYRTHFFDSQGNVTTQTLSYADGTWTWQGAHTRCTGVFKDGGKLLTAHHERSDDGAQWVHSMTVTLRKID